MNEAPPRLRLRVSEAPQSDVGLGRARVDSKTRLALGIETEEIVEIVGKTSTATRLFPLPQEDEEKGIVRIDGLVRRNARVDVGDMVEVRRADVRAAEHVTLAPVISGGHKISFGLGIENFVKRGLLKRPVTKGNVVIVPGVALMGGALPFMVVAAEPRGIVLVAEETSFEISEQPVSDQYFVSPEVRFETLLRQLRDFLRSQLASFDADLEGLPDRDSESAGRLAEAMRRLLLDVEALLQDRPDRGG